MIITEHVIVRLKTTLYASVPICFTHSTRKLTKPIISDAAGELDDATKIYSAVVFW